MIPVVLGVLFVTLCDEDEEGSECVVWRAALRVRPGAGVSALPLTIWGGCCLTGMLCLREEGREGTGEGSFFAFTLDDTRLFLSGLEMKSKSNRVWHQVKKYIFKAAEKVKFHLPGRGAACRRFASPPPPLHYVPCLSVCSVSCLSVGALFGQFISQAVDGFVVSQDGADMLLKQGRKP